MLALLKVPRDPPGILALINHPFPLQRVSENAGNLDNVYTFLKLDLTDATRIKQVQDLTGAREGWRGQAVLPDLWLCPGGEAGSGSVAALYPRWLCPTSP